MRRAAAAVKSQVDADRRLTHPSPPPADIYKWFVQADQLARLRRALKTIYLPYLATTGPELPRRAFPPPPEPLQPNPKRARSSDGAASASASALLAAAPALAPHERVSIFVSGVGEPGMTPAASLASVLDDPVSCILAAAAQGSAFELALAFRFAGRPGVSQARARARTGVPRTLGGSVSCQF